MSSELNQLIENCLNDKLKYEKLTLPKLLNSNLIELDFIPNDDKISNDVIDLLIKYPVMDSDYMNAKLVELNLLNGNDEITNKLDDLKLENQLDEGNKIDRRNIYEAWLEFKSNEKYLEFNPGDSIGKFKFQLIL